MTGSPQTKRPGAIGSGLYRARSSSPHNWSGDWHLGMIRKAPGPTESFAQLPTDRPARRLASPSGDPTSAR